MFQVTFRKPLLAGLITSVLLPATTRAAITFEYSSTPGVDVFKQTENSPCVIGDPSCNQPKTGSATMFYDSNAGSPGSDYDLFSTVYLASASNNFTLQQIPLSFFIGVDDNFSVQHEQLVAFNTYLCGAGSSVSTSNSSGATALPSNCVNGQISAANSWNSTNAPTYALQDMSLNANGNGTSNFILKGFNLSPGSFYAFEAVVHNDNDGFEEFFIIPSGTAPIPEPVTSALVGSGLIALFFVRRRVCG